MAKRVGVDKWIFFTTLLLVSVGLAMVFSASAVVSEERYHSPYIDVARQAAWALAGVFSMIILMRIDYTRYNSPRFIYPATDKATAKAHLEAGVLHFAKRQVAEGRFPPGLDTDGYLGRLHCFYGHPDEIIAELKAEQTLPIATDVLCQVNPGVPTFDQTLKAMELIATKIAPAMGWR